MREKAKVLPHPKLVNQPVLADSGWTSGSHCKSQVYSVGGRGCARSGRWTPTPGHFSIGGADTSVDLVGRALE